MEGYIKLHRKLMDSIVFSNETTLKVFVWLLLKANFSDKHVPIKKGRGYINVFVKRGQVIYGRLKAQESCGVNGYTMERHIRKLKSDDTVKIDKFHSYTIITIVNYDQYNDRDLPETAQVKTTKQQLSPKDPVAKKDPEINTPAAPTPASQTGSYTFSEALDFIAKPYDEYPAVFKEKWKPDWFNSYKKYIELIQANYPNLTANIYQLSIFDYHKLYQDTKFKLAEIDWALKKLASIGVKSDALFKERLKDAIGWSREEKKNGNHTPAAETKYTPVKKTIDHRN